jgi:hypothetical protein
VVVAESLFWPFIVSPVAGGTVVIVSDGSGAGFVFIESVAGMVSASEGVVVCSSFLQLITVSPKIRAVVTIDFI